LRISLICVGKLGRAPEAALAADYAKRASASGRSFGLGPVEIIEVEGRKAGRASEVEAILARADGARLIACDEQGAALASRAFAGRLTALRDDGVRRLAFAIGGADGLDAAVLDAAAEQLAFGPQTWPHALARVMLAEQVYRATTIAAGGPYHRD
jgi:23S rRNA (pseudouridine1915-N3)-methyltransferase